MIKVAFDLSDFKRQLDNNGSSLKQRLKRSVTAAASILANGYLAAIPRSIKVGTYQSASEGIKHFQYLYMSIGVKNQVFKSGEGAYTVVGIKAAPGNWRPVAPQGIFLEWGTDERRTKTGQYTGKVTPRLLLTNAVETHKNTAVNAMIQEMTR